MAATTLTADQQTAALNAAAQKYGLPIGILNGVYGIETGYGQNIATSSAGAIGPFQFLPSTAKQYGYPLTNTPTAAEFQQQADAAAHYLSDLFKSHGGNLKGGSGWAAAWDAALHAYSGGGYGYSQVLAKSGHGPLQSIVNPPSLISQGVNAVGSALGTAGDFFGLITSGSFWLRVLEALGGIILLALGLISLTGGSAQQVANVAARVAK